MNRSVGTFVGNTMTDPTDHESIIDVDLALTYTAGDRDMLISIAELFLQEGPLQLQAVEHAVEQGDAAQAGKAAQTLKGSVNNFCSAAAVAAAGKMERAAAAGDWQEFSPAWQSLNREMERLFSEVEKLCRG